MKKYWAEMRTDTGRFGSLELLIIEADSHKEAAQVARCQQPNWCVLSTEEIKECQPWYVSHAETIAQNVVGQIIAFILLWLFGITGIKAIWMQLAFFAAAYTRGYLIRRAFNRWGHLITRKAQ